MAHLVSRAPSHDTLPNFLTLNGIIVKSFLKFFFDLNGEIFSNFFSRKELTVSDKVVSFSDLKMIKNFMIKIPITLTRSEFRKKRSFLMKSFPEI